MRFQGQQNNRWVSSLTLRWYSHDPESTRSLEKPRTEASRLIWEVWSIKEYWYRWSHFLNAGWEAKLKSAWKIYERMEMLG